MASAVQHDVKGVEKLKDLYMDLAQVSSFEPNRVPNGRCSGAHGHIRPHHVDHGRWPRQRRYDVGESRDGRTEQDGDNRLIDRERSLRDLWKL